MDGCFAFCGWLNWHVVQINRATRYLSYFFSRSGENDQVYDLLMRTPSKKVFSTLLQRFGEFQRHLFSWFVIQARRKVLCKTITDIDNAVTWQNKLALIFIVCRFHDKIVRQFSAKIYGFNLDYLIYCRWFSWLEAHTFRVESMRISYQFFRLRARVIGL